MNFYRLIISQRVMIQVCKDPTVFVLIVVVVFFIFGPKNIMCAVIILIFTAPRTHIPRYFVNMASAHDAFGFQSISPWTREVTVCSQRDQPPFPHLLHSLLFGSDRSQAYLQQRMPKFSIAIIAGA